MPERQYTVRWTQTAVDLLEAVSDKRLRKALFDRAGQLKQTPAQQGKPLLGEFTGFRSIKVQARRYRIVYHVEDDEVVVVVVAVGLRKEGDRRDVYALAKKLLKHGLIPGGRSR